MLFVQRAHTKVVVRQKNVVNKNITTYNVVLLIVCASASRYYIHTRTARFKTRKPNAETRFYNNTKLTFALFNSRITKFLSHVCINIIYIFLVYDTRRLTKSTRGLAQSTGTLHYYHTHFIEYPSAERRLERIINYE